ncbi:MAG: hypothetical protein HZC40_11935 [Chloroflexi bacterium]|nr:hypothetical protein [Chloroflexota bacterium]
MDPKKKRRLVWVGWLLVAGLLWWSWCWGWWGNDNLFLQYLFHCKYPPLSEETRYPASVDVLVSECVDAHLEDISPNGRYLIVSYPGTEFPTQPLGAYLYDLQSKELKPVNGIDAGDFSPRFVTDDWLLEIRREPYRIKWEETKLALVNPRNGRRLVLNRVPMSPNHEIESGMLQFFHTAEQVYVLELGLAVALAPNFVEHPEANFVLGRQFDGPTDMERIRKILDENGIPYQVQVPYAYPPTSYGEDLSRNRLFKYYFGIYLVSNNEMVFPALVEVYLSSNFRDAGWAYEDRGVILDGGQTYLIGGGDSISCCGPKWFPVARPILLLKVPKEYLSPELRQQEEMHEAWEQTAKALAAVVFWVGWMALAWVCATLFGWRDQVQGWRKRKQ